MNNAFERKCGYFNPDIPNGGPPPTRRRKRRDDEDDDFDDYEESIFTIDFEGAENESGYSKSSMEDYLDYDFGLYIPGFIFLKNF